MGKLMEKLKFTRHSIYLPVLNIKMASGHVYIYIYIYIYVYIYIYIYIEKEQVNEFEAKSFHLKPIEERHQQKKTNLSLGLLTRPQYKDGQWDSHIYIQELTTSDQICDIYQKQLLKINS